LPDYSHHNAASLDAIDQLGGDISTYCSVAKLEGQPHWMAKVTDRGGVQTLTLRELGQLIDG
jgi:hypothetical protein